MVLGSAIPPTGQMLGASFWANSSRRRSLITLAASGWPLFSADSIVAYSQLVSVSTSRGPSITRYLSRLRIGDDWLGPGQGHQRLDMDRVPSRRNAVLP